MPKCLTNCPLREQLLITKLKKLRYEEILLNLKEILYRGSPSIIYHWLPVLEPRAMIIDHAEKTIRLLKKKIRKICKTLKKGCDLCYGEWNKILLITNRRLIFINIYAKNNLEVEHHIVYFSCKKVNKPTYIHTSKNSSKN